MFIAGTLLSHSNSQSGTVGWFSSFFLKSLITDLIKPIGCPASKYFFVENTENHQD